MAENEQVSIYKKVIPVNDGTGELKIQYTIDLTPWDTSKMDTFKEGDVVRTGHSFCIKTLKPNKKYPRQRVDIDPSDKDFRKAMQEMYAKYDETIKK